MNNEELSDGFKSDSENEMDDVKYSINVSCQKVGEILIQKFKAKRKHKKPVKIQYDFSSLRKSSRSTKVQMNFSEDFMSQKNWEIAEVQAAKMEKERKRKIKQEKSEEENSADSSENQVKMDGEQEKSDAENSEDSPENQEKMERKQEKSEEENSEDSHENQEKIERKQEKSEAENSEDSHESEEEQVVEENTSKEKTPKQLSAYEEFVAKKRAERLAFLESLKMDEVKADFNEAVENVFQNKTKPRKRHKKVEKSLLPPRKSSRSTKVNINFSEDTLREKNLEKAKKESEKSEYKQVLPRMSFKYALKKDELYEKLQEDINISSIQNAAQKKCFKYNKSTVKNLNFQENIFDRMAVESSGLAWYPSAEPLIIAASSDHGIIGLWNIKPDSFPYLFKVCSCHITCLKFNPYNSNQLFTTSCSKTQNGLTCGDLSKQVFKQVYNAEPTNCCTYFDFISDSVFLVSQTKEIAIVDIRLRDSCSLKSPKVNFINTIDIHPLDKNISVCADLQKGIGIWDLRNMEKPVFNINHNKTHMHSAFFSPLTGNSVLTTDDDAISLLSSKNPTSNMKVKDVKIHSKPVQRSTYQATWLPNSDETFVICSTSSPYNLEIHDGNMNVLAVQPSNVFNSISILNAFHPCVPALACANLAGTVSVFT